LDELEPRATRLSLTVPRICPACANVGSVVLQVTVDAGTVTFDWCCGACDLLWPVTAGEPAHPAKVELRMKADRRKTTRSDERG
jgi:hypothetical protein